jgi:hypothetical protein
MHSDQINSIDFERPIAFIVSWQQRPLITRPSYRCSGVSMTPLSTEKHFYHDLDSSLQLRMTVY